MQEGRPIRRLTWPLLTTCVASLACGGGNDNGGGPVVATRLDLSPSTLIVSDCRSDAVQAAAYDDQNQPVTGLVITFSTSDANVVQVNGSGSVTGQGAGSAWVRASAGSLSDSTQVTVVDSVTYHMLFSHAANIAVGGLDTLRAEARDCRGAVRAAPAPTFTAVQAGVVSVTPQGVVSPLSVGLAYVRVTLGPLTDSVDVAVVTHPAGVLGTPTIVAGSPFGIAVRRSGEVVTALLQGGAVGVLPAGGGSSTSFAAGSLPTDIATSLDGRTGFVANQGSAAMGRLDLVGSTQTGSISVGFNPFRALRSRDGDRYYVGGNGTGVRAHDAATGVFITAYTMEMDQNGLAESPDGAYLYASSMAGGVVREISLASGTVGRTFVTGVTPQEVVVSADGAELFVASEGSLSLGVWNLSSGSKVDSVTVGAGTFGMALSPDGTRLYAGSTASGKVYVIDPSTHAVLDSLPTGGIPRRIAFNRTGTIAYVANESGWVDLIQ